MKKIIDKLNFNIDEFKNNYWYSKTIEIPQFIKNIEPNISEIDLFNKLLFNVFQTCDLFINQKMSQFLALDLTLEQIIEILGKQRVSNFICSVYTEIKYRLATEKFPEFSQRDKLITSNFSLATAGREFNNFQSLLSAEAIAYLSYPSWNDLRINCKDDYVNILEYLKTNNDKTNNILDKFNEKIKKIDEFKNKLNSVDEACNKLNEFDTKIEKLLKDNSESDENLKLSFSKFKSDQLEINNKKENKLSDNVRNFLNNNIESPDYLGTEDGDDYLKITFDNDELGMDVCGEEYQTYIRPEGISIGNAGKGIDLFFDEISFPHPRDESKPKQTINYENVEKWNTSIAKVISLDKDIEDIKKLNSNEIKTKIEKVSSDVENIIPRVSTIENLQSEQQLKFKTLSEKSINNENNILDILNKIKNINNSAGNENNVSNFNSLEIFKKIYPNYELKKIEGFNDIPDEEKLLEYLRKNDFLGLIIYVDNAVIALFERKSTQLDGNEQEIGQITFVGLPFENGIIIDEEELPEEYRKINLSLALYHIIKLNKNLENKQDKTFGLDSGSNDAYTLINFSKPQTKIRIGSNADQGYISNFFFDRERDGMNIVRYIEKDNETFLNLTPALQSDTHVEIGIKNSNKYISLKIDNEELLLDKTKLLKLKSLLS